METGLPLLSFKLELGNCVACVEEPWGNLRPAAVWCVREEVSTLEALQASAPGTSTVTPWQGGGSSPENPFPPSQQPPGGGI